MHRLKGMSLDSSGSSSGVSTTQSISGMRRRKTAPVDTALEETRSFRLFQVDDGYQVRTPMQPLGTI